MGQVRVTAKFENLVDAVAAHMGTLPADQVRSVEVADALVDTGAMFLGMPKRLITQIGLVPMRTRQARTAAGVVTVQVYDAVRLTVEDRPVTCEVMELPDDCPVLIGQIPLEALDFIVDMPNRRLIGNPEHGGQFMMDALLTGPLGVEWRHGGAPMPLLDHFHPPLKNQRHWESFHASWCTEIMADLNLGRLPPGYYAETQTHLGAQVEMDVAAFRGVGPADGSRNGHGLTVAEATALVLPAKFPDDFEIQVINGEGGPTVVEVIEMVSPGNKDRPETRRSFAAKIIGYLDRGIGVVVVDIVTTRHANMHDALIDAMGADVTLRFPGAAPLYTVSYRPAVDGMKRIEARPYPLAVGQALSTPGLALRRGPIVAIDLEGTYARTRQHCMI